MINKSRLQECIDILSMVLKNEGDETISIGDQEYNRQEFITMTTKYLFRILIDDEEKSEEYLLFFIDSIHYTLGLTDTSPILELIQKEEMQKIHEFYTKDKFKVKTN